MISNPSPGKCPYCGYLFNRSSCIHGYPMQPENGTISLCMKCKEISVFVDGEYIIRDKNTELSIDQISFIHSTRMLVEHHAKNAQDQR